MQTTLRSFAQFIFKTNYCVFANFWTVRKRHSLVGGLFVEIGDVVVVDKIVIFLVVKILLVVILFWL